MIRTMLNILATQRAQRESLKIPAVAIRPKTPQIIATIPITVTIETPPMVSMLV